MRVGLKGTPRNVGPSGTIRTENESTPRMSCEAR
jgi:hypothetical protein